MRRFFVACGFGLGLFATPAAADVATDDPDLRCAAIGLMLAASSDEAQQNAGTMIAVHYIGKLQGRDQSIDLEEELFQFSLVATEVGMAADQVRCGTEFQTLGYDMIRMGENLQRRARQLEGAN
jgi:hypothetical protein